MNNILLYAVPFFALFVGLEMYYISRELKQKYHYLDALSSIALGIGNLLSGLVVKTLIFSFYLFIYQYRLWDLNELKPWLFFLILFLGDDFSYYWFHRKSHEIRFFWASHLVHHSSEKYTLATALRQTWTGSLTGTFVFWAWMPLIGFHPLYVLMMQSISLVYQFWIHTETVKKLPRWIEYIFNTPSHHRVHHGTNIDYLDKNHGGILIIWDRIFRTFENEKETPNYGLLKQVNTLNPVKVAFHGWTELWNELLEKNHWKYVFHYLIKAPGWSPDGSSLTTKELRQKYNKS